MKKYGAASSVYKNGSNARSLYIREFDLRVVLFRYLGI